MAFSLPNVTISIHALREEGDPAWGQTEWWHPISIHALREEGDEGSERGRSIWTNFYPRPPRGGRQ